MRPTPEQVLANFRLVADALERAGEQGAWARVITIADVMLECRSMEIFARDRQPRRAAKKGYKPDPIRRRYYELQVRFSKIRNSQFNHRTLLTVRRARRRMVGKISRWPDLDLPEDLGQQLSPEDRAFLLKRRPRWTGKPILG